MGSTKKLVRRRRAIKDHGDDLENRRSFAVVATRWLESHGHGWIYTHIPQPDANVTAMGDHAMTVDPVTDRTMPVWGQRLHGCPFVKITQLLGEVHCYLLPGHDGAHCSAEWMEWS
jgi:hypothetical protein